jgi:hypothetical protein
MASSRSKAACGPTKHPGSTPGASTGPGYPPVLGWLPVATEIGASRLQPPRSRARPVGSGGCWYPGTMTALLTNQEIALWTSQELEDVVADPFAQEVNTKVGDLVCFLGGHLDWNPVSAPVDVRTIALWMFRRTYTNPDQEVSSNVGPLGSRVLDEAAMAMSLTESERTTLQSYKDAATGAGPGLFTMSIAGGRRTLEPTVFLSDDQQINLGDLDPWRIPFTDPNDVNNPVVI